MANVKITELTADTNPASSDVLPFVDISADETKKVTIADLLENAGDGAAATPAFSFDSDKNTGIYRPGADQLAISTGGASRIVIDSSGNVGIGTTSPGNPLVVKESSNICIDLLKSTDASILTIGEDGSSGALFNAPIGAMVFQEGGSEAMRIDSAGRLLVGTSISPSGGDGHAQNARLLVQGRVGVDADSGRINLQRGSAASNGSSIGAISFTDNSNNAYARLEVEADAATGSGDYPGRFVFFTTADGASTPAERMRLDSEGALSIFNGTAPTASATNGVKLYAEDVSSSSELKVRDEAGNVTTLSPHNFNLIPEGPSEDMAWSYYSEKDGKRINVDMLRAVRLLEQLTGEQLVFTG